MASWEAGRTYDEPAEFVDSIPFTETREYVQVVMRNGAIYRQVYAPESIPRNASGKVADLQDSAEPKTVSAKQKRGKR